MTRAAAGTQPCSQHIGRKILILKHGDHTVRRPTCALDNIHVHLSRCTHPRATWQQVTVRAASFGSQRGIMWCAGAKR